MTHTATATRVTRPVAPAQPADLRWLIEDHNKAMRALNNGVRYAGQIGPMDPATRLSLCEDIRAYQEMITEWYTTPAGVAYRAAVDAYNAQAAAWNGQIKTDRQARINSREVAKTRSQACGRCYATHAGEC